MAKNKKPTPRKKRKRTKSPNHKAGPGRDSKLTPQVQETILKYVKQGAPYEAAAGAVGITARTLRDWRKRGREGDKAFSSFSSACDQASNSWEVKTFVKLSKSKNPYVLLQLLKLRNPKRYGDRKYEEAEINAHYRRIRRKERDGT